MSTLVFRPSLADHDQFLRCVVENPALKNSKIEDSVKLKIHCKYLLHLKHLNALCNRAPARLFPGERERAKVELGRE